MATRLDRLSDYGIVGNRTKTEEVFLKIEKHFRSNKDTPSVYVQKLWGKYQQVIPEKKRIIH